MGSRIPSHSSTTLPSVLSIYLIWPTYSKTFSYTCDIVHTSLRSWWMHGMAVARFENAEKVKCIIRIVAKWGTIGGSNGPDDVGWGSVDMSPRTILKSRCTETPFPEFSTFIVIAFTTARLSNQHFVEVFPQAIGGTLCLTDTSLWEKKLKTMYEKAPPPDYGHYAIYICTYILMVCVKAYDTIGSLRSIRKGIFGCITFLD